MDRSVMNYYSHKKVMSRSDITFFMNGKETIRSLDKTDLIS